MSDVARNRRLVLKTDFTAEDHDDVAGMGGGYGTTMRGTYTIDREKGTVSVKFTKSEYECSGQPKEEKDFDVKAEYTLDVLGVK